MAELLVVLFKLIVHPHPSLIDLRLASHFSIDIGIISSSISSLSLWLDWQQLWRSTSSKAWICYWWSA
jgi:hypothetical protein